MMPSYLAARWPRTLDIVLAIDWSALIVHPFGGCHEPEQDFVTIGNSSKTLRFSLAKITNTTQENF